MTTKVIPFQFQSNDIRVVERNGENWFVAMDIAAALDYTDTQAMTRRLDDDEVDNRQIVGFKNYIMCDDKEGGSKTIPPLSAHGGSRGVTLVNESGLYSAILGSTKPEAKAFKKWITSEVLPSIRKTGKYQAKKDKEPEVPLGVARKEFNTLYRMLLDDGLNTLAALSATNLAIRATTGHDFEWKIEAAITRRLSLEMSEGGDVSAHQLDKSNWLTINTAIATTAQACNTMVFTITNWLCNRMDLISLDQLPRYRLIEAINILKVRCEFDAKEVVAGELE